MSYFADSRYVRELTPKDFKGGNPNLSGCSVVLYYADWCGHCKAMKDEYEKFASSAAFIRVYAINMAKYNSPELPVINGYPTIIYYNDGVSRVHSGSRKAYDLVREAMKMCESE